MTKGVSACKGCGVSVPTNEVKIYSGKKYCNMCYKLKLQEKIEYDSLIKSIMNYYNIDIPNGLILKQIKEYKEQFNYTYAGIQYCLWYCNEIKGCKFDIKYGIAIVKYEYENAKNYFMQQQKVRESVQNIKHEEKTKTVKVNINKKSNKDKFIINLDDVIRGGEI